MKPWKRSPAPGRWSAGRSKTIGFFLDTNVCSAHFRRPGGLAHRVFQYEGRLYVPTVVIGELYAGASRLDDPSRLVEKIEKLVKDTQVLTFDEICAERFGRVRGELHRIGITANTVDLMIAAVALVHDLTLVTHKLAP